MRLTPAYKGLVFLMLLLLIQAHLTIAQDSLRVIGATRITEKIKVDGNLDDAAWQQAIPFEGKFYQIEPDNGAESAYISKVSVVYDNKAIYVGAILYDPDPQSIPQELGVRDDFELNVDAFAFNIDTYNQGQSGFSYIVTAAGVQADAIITSRDFDRNWNAVWNSEVSITDEGWVVEMEIPYSAIRFPNKKDHVWGVNFYRASKRLNEASTWNFVNQEVEGFLNQSGELHGLSEIKPPLRLSFLPYFAIGIEHDAATNSSARSYAGGMDMKLGISESFTLDMSLVPDFSQVQSDNVILNLSPFEVRYDENRPFFTEGVELFNKGRIFYSRRIGQVRGYGFEDNLTEGEEIVENPFTNQLINATKISGRTGGGTGIGFFNAITAKSYATVEDSLGNRRDVLIDPLTNFNVVVIDQTLKNNSYIGLINTNVVRVGDYRDANVTVADFRIRDKTNTWSVFGSGGLSQIFTADEGVSVNTQGFRTRLFLSKVSGKLQYSLGGTVESDQWDINDLGFMRRNNRIEYSSRISYSIYKPFSIFNNMSVRASFEYEQLYRPQTYVTAEYGLNFNAQFRNFYNFGLSFDLNPYDNYDYYEPRELGYYFKTSGNYSSHVSLGTDRRKKLNLGMYVGIWHRPEDNARSVFGGFGPSYRVSNRMNIDYDLNVRIARDGKGYVTKLYDSLDNLSEIIFGRRDQNTITNMVGLKYTFTNKMGLSFRMRHYWSWVEHDKYYNLEDNGELTESDYTGLDENGLPIHNTTFNAFNIDMVYSWQVAPGSFFTAVWKNQIYADSEVPQKNFLDNLDRTFNQNGTNSITLKLVYYIDINYFKKKEL